jgi:hypothetical protein
LERSPLKFLIVEGNEKGTTAYCPESTSGQRLEGRDLWKLSGFMKMLLGEGGEMQ